MVQRLQTSVGLGDTTKLLWRQRSQSDQKTMEFGKNGMAGSLKLKLGSRSSFSSTMMHKKKSAVREIVNMKVRRRDQFNLLFERLPQSNKTKPQLTGISRAQR